MKKIWKLLLYVFAVIGIISFNCCKAQDIKKIFEQQVVSLVVDFKRVIGNADTCDSSYFETEVARLKRKIFILPRIDIHFDKEKLEKHKQIIDAIKRDLTSLQGFVQRIRETDDFGLGLREEQPCVLL